MLCSLFFGSIMNRAMSLYRIQYILEKQKHGLEWYKHEWAMIWSLQTQLSLLSHRAVRLVQIDLLYRICEVGRFICLKLFKTQWGVGQALIRLVLNCYLKHPISLCRELYSFTGLYLLSTIYVLRGQEEYLCHCSGWFASYECISPTPSAEESIYRNWSARAPLWGGLVPPLAIPTWSDKSPLSAIWFTWPVTVSGSLWPFLHSSECILVGIDQKILKSCKRLQFLAERCNRFLALSEPTGSNC